MTTQPQNDANEGSLKKCLVCKQGIDEKAIKCAKCGSFQNWRRHVKLSGAILSLLVALVSVSGLAIPIILESIRGGQSLLKIGVSFTNDTHAYLHFQNNGDEPGLVESIQFEVAGYKVSFSPDQLGEELDERLLRPKSAGVIRLASDELEFNEFSINMPMDAVEAYMEDMYQWSSRADPEDGFALALDRNGWPAEDIPPNGLNAKVTDDNYESLERLSHQIYIGLYRVQYLSADVTIKDLKEVNFDDWYEVTSYEDVLTVVREHWDYINDYVDHELLSSYIESNEILAFLDFVFTESSSTVTVRARNSNGTVDDFVIPVDYQDWRLFLRPVVLDTIESSEWLNFFR